MNYVQPVPAIGAPTAAIDRPFVDKLFDGWNLLLMFGPLLGSFYPLESYFGSWTNAAVETLPYPITPISLVLVSLTIAAMYLRLRKQGRVLHCYPAYLFILMALASMIWAPEPQFAFQRTLRLLPAVGLGVMFAQYYSTRRFLQLISLAVLASAIASIIMGAFFPAFGHSGMSQGYETAWRGAITHKNFAGLTYALGIMFVGYARLINAISLRLAVPTILACAFMLIMSSSLTPLVSMVAAVTVTLATLLVRKSPLEVRMLLALCVFVPLVGMVMLMLLAPDVFVSLAGRDLTLTGRTDIWSAVWHQILANPVRGYGYAFWASPSPARDVIWSEVPYTPPHSHNSWLDLWLQLGLVGLVSIALLMLRQLRRAFSAVSRQSNPMAPLFLTLMVFLFIESLTEVLFSEPGVAGIVWLVWVSVSLDKDRAARRVAFPPTSMPLSTRSAP